MKKINVLLITLLLLAGCNKSEQKTQDQVSSTVSTTEISKVQENKEAVTGYKEYKFGMTPFEVASANPNCSIGKTPFLTALKSNEDYAKEQLRGAIDRNPDDTETLDKLNAEVQKFKNPEFKDQYALENFKGCETVIFEVYSVISHKYNNNKLSQVNIGLVGPKEGTFSKLKSLLDEKYNLTSSPSSEEKAAYDSGSSSLAELRWEYENGQVILATGAGGKVIAVVYSDAETAHAEKQARSERAKESAKAKADEANAF